MPERPEPFETLTLGKNTMEAYYMKNPVTGAIGVRAKIINNETGNFMSEDFETPELYRAWKKKSEDAYAAQSQHK